MRTAGGITRDPIDSAPWASDGICLGGCRSTRIAGRLLTPPSLAATSSIRCLTIWIPRCVGRLTVTQHLLRSTVALRL